MQIFSLFRQPNLHLNSLAYQPESEPPSVRKHILPFDLDIIHTHVKYWAGDAGTLLHRIGIARGVHEIDASRQVWIEHGASLFFFFLLLRFYIIPRHSPASRTPLQI